MDIHVINNCHTRIGGMSGGDRIIIELVRRYEKGKIFLYTSNFGAATWGQYKLNNVKPIKFINFKRQTGFSSYPYRTLIGCLELSKIKIKLAGIIYSASDFWPDSIPAFIMKLKNPKSKWIAGFYLFAPAPFQKDSPYKGKKWLAGLLYWLTQLPIYFIVKRYADMVFVTSEPDVNRFVTKRRGRDRVVVIRGGVDIKPSDRYLNSSDIIPVNKRKYDVCFVGRFHYQKGALELIDIWKYACEKKPGLKLAMIGCGPLENEIKKKINEYKLSDNIDLLGFKDGNEKYEIFKQSKVVVHPATYDSGGMAACEAMAWGLPGVSFDLEALKTYYPKGMLKTPCYNFKVFACNILKLLEDSEMHNRMSQDAISWARTWDWDKRAANVFNIIKQRLF
jgi:glycosyltransferase involved in cell wall biosynthesis